VSQKRDDLESSGFGLAEDGQRSRKVEWEKQQQQKKDKPTKIWIYYFS